MYEYIDLTIDFAKLYRKYGADWHDRDTFNIKKGEKQNDTIINATWFDCLDKYKLGSR